MVKNMTRAVAFAPRFADLWSTGTGTHGGDRVAASAGLTALYRRPLAPIPAAQGTALSVARTRTTDGSPPREAPV